MKKWSKALGLIFVMVLFFTGTAFAASVKGYYRSDGTYVQPYQRSTPNSSPYDNYNRPGNYNPNKGIITPGDLNTYDNNYYQKKQNNNYNSGLQ